MAHELLNWARLRGRPARLRSRGAGLAVTYHEIAERPGDPERELLPALDLDGFADQISYLKRRFRLVRASELFPAARQRRRGGRVPLALTFDDDLASHAELALPVLTRLGVPATFFLGGVSLAGEGPPWWMVLQRAADRGELKASELAQRAHELERSRPEQREEAIARLRTRYDEDLRGDLLDAAGIERLAGAGMEIGFHTVEHPYLPLLDRADIAAAMQRGRPELERLAGDPITAIAYPHGGADERVINAARDAGFETGFTTAGGHLRPNIDPLAIGRVEAPRGSRRALARRLDHALGT